MSSKSPGPASGLVSVAPRGAAIVLTLERPDAKNALSAELVAALSAALDATAKESARGVVLAGAGADFCAGADLKELQQAPSRSRAENLGSSRSLAALFRAIRLHPKPVVAAVRGFALAGGAGLACACDRVVAAGDAKLGFTEARIGFVAAIVARFAVERTGPRVARELLLTARRVDAGEALALGLVDELAPAGADPVERAVAWIETLKPCSPESLAATKRLLAGLAGRELDAGLEWAADFNAQARSSPDFLEGVAAFLEKRKPRWLAEP
jgi:methylglutaconyl-CoA hydratase